MISKGVGGDSDETPIQKEVESAGGAKEGNPGELSDDRRASIGAANSQAIMLIHKPNLISRGRARAQYIILGNIFN